MVKVKPFAAIRPPKAIVTEVAARPYDVLNSQEAKAEAGEKSLLHITKPEIDFDPIIDVPSSTSTHSPLTTRLSRTSRNGRRKAGSCRTRRSATMYMHRP